MDEKDQPGFSPVAEFDPLPERERGAGYRQSKLGIASFIIGLISVIGFIVCTIAAASSIMDYIDANGNTVQNIEEIVTDSSLVVSALLMMFFVADSVIGLILGIVGACTRHTRKAFAVIGIVLNALLTVGFAGLFLLGILAQYAS